MCLMEDRILKVGQDGRVGDWISTLSGLQFYPFDPRPEEIDIIDVAKGLSLQCRYAGQVLWHYSIAQHSYYVSMLCDPEDALSGLLHDLSEFIICDLPRPIKPMLKEYLMAEDAIMKVAAKKFGFDYPKPPSVEFVDRNIVRNEIEALRPTPPEWANRYIRLEGLVVEEWSPSYAEQMFLNRYEELSHATV